MHELLLYASVPSSRHDQVLSVLSGIAAMQPQPFHERRVIYKPTRPATRPVTQVGGTQAVQKNPVQAMQGAMQGDLFYLHLVEDLVGEGRGGSGGVGEESEKGRPNEGMLMNGEDGEDEAGANAVTEIPQKLPSPSLISINKNPPSSSTSTGKYTLQFNDIPESGNLRPVTSRLTASIPITGGDASAFMSAMEYTQTSTHHLVGHALTHASTRILLFQPFLPLSQPPNPTDTNSQSNPPSQILPPSDSSYSSPPSTTFPSQTLATNPSTANPSQLLPLEPIHHILQLSLLVSDGTKPELMTRGVKELMALKEMLRGCVELEVPERGGLDSRFRG
ncbi:MAG: hypothetical protein LQ343_003678 [Gyalolechia ehrenbergii]|nr:MAG: hypothetical protein LQ343_003678 [Gyalolechia ehrenbergii]